MYSYQYSSFMISQGFVSLEAPVDSLNVFTIGISGGYMIKNSLCCNASSSFRE